VLALAAAKLVVRTRAGLLGGVHDVATGRLRLRWNKPGHTSDVLEPLVLRKKASAFLPKVRFGSEFGEEYLEWCDDHDVRARFGAVGRHGSIAVEERFIRTLKEEGLAHEIVPLRHTAFCASLARIEDWYNEVRPHPSMGGATPDEVFHGRRPANRRRRFEPRARYPAKGACAAPWAPARAKSGARLELVATPFRGARHLAQIEIRRGD